MLGFALAGIAAVAGAPLPRPAAELARHWAAVRPSAAIATGPRAVYARLSGEDPDVARRPAAQALAAVARPRTEPARAALSRTAAGVSELPALRSKVDDVLRVTTGHPDAPRVAALPDVHARVLLAHVADELGRQPRLRHSGIEAMLEYDRTRNTYAASVLVWLGVVGNVGEAARRLTVHQNTLKYRLRRTHELFGLDLEHPDDRLSCWLQLRISTPL